MQQVIELSDQGQRNDPSREIAPRGKLCSKALIQLSRPARFTRIICNMASQIMLGLVLVIVKVEDRSSLV